MNKNIKMQAKKIVYDVSNQTILFGKKFIWVNKIEYIYIIYFCKNP